MDKQAQLQQTLGALSPRQVLALARGIETERVLGRETLPTEVILAAIRPQLRTERSPRVPTLCRLACLSFEDFLTDRQDDPRPPGVISRAVIAPWWQGLQHIADAQIWTLENQLKSLVGASDRESAAAFARTVSPRVREWTDALLAELRARKGDPALKKLFTDPMLIVDLQEIARTLPLGADGALNKAIDAVIHVAALHGQAAGRHILDLTPEAVTEAKKQYLHITELFGMEARYFALALLNKLERPWQVLRLGRALSWKQDDTLVRDTEFGIIGQRLITELAVTTRELCAIAAEGNAVPDLAAVHDQMVCYIDSAEGLLGEFGFRRDSPWGEAIFQTRVAVAHTIGREFLAKVGTTVLGVLPQTGRPRSHRDGVADLLTAPDEETIGHAIDGARFLNLLVQRGARHGFATSARATIDHVGQETERRAGALLAAVRSSSSNPAISAQIDAAVQVCNTLFDSDRGEMLARKFRNAECASPRTAVYGVSP